MNLSFSAFLFGTLVLLSISGDFGKGLQAAQAPSPTPSATSSPMTSTPVSKAVATAVPGNKLSPLECRSLIREFERAQKAETRALEHRQKFEMKELDASQESRRKEWEKKEQDARHRFFHDHSDGRSRRDYMKDFKERRKTFLAILKDEATERSQEHSVRLRSVLEDQKQKKREFEASIGRGVTPAKELWPGNF